MDANLRRVFLTQEIQADVVYNREIFVGMTEPDARFIFPKRDIEDPMQTIFNAQWLLTAVAKVLTEEKLSRW